MTRSEVRTTSTEAPTGPASVLARRGRCYRGVCEALKGRQRRRVASAHEAHEPVTLLFRLAWRQFGDELEHVAKITDVGHEIVQRDRRQPVALAFGQAVAPALKQRLEMPARRDSPVRLFDALGQGLRRDEGAENLQNVVRQIVTIVGFALPEFELALRLVDHDFEGGNARAAAPQRKQPAAIVGDVERVVHQAILHGVRFDGDGLHGGKRDDSIAAERRRGDPRIGDAGWSELHEACEIAEPTFAHDSRAQSADFRCPAREIA